MPKSILDRSFHYVPAASTDIRRTFARVRREQKAREAAVRQPDQPKVAAIGGRRK